MPCIIIIIPLSTLACLAKHTSRIKDLGSNKVMEIVVSTPSPSLTKDDSIEKLNEKGCQYKHNV